MHIPQARQASRSPGWLATAALAALSLSTPAVSGTAPDGDPGAASRSFTASTARTEPGRRQHGGGAFHDGTAYRMPPKAT